MLQLARSRSLNLLIAALFALSFVASACSAGGGDGAPSTPGQYSVQKDSVHFDGDRYQLYWADTAGALHRLDTRNLRMLRDPDRTYLEVQQGGGDPILHLKEDEPITVEGRDHQGAFSSPWFPFLLGATLGNAFGGRGGGGTVIINNPAPGERSYGAGTPAYRYPPTGSFGRDDELHGSIDTSKPQAPDYSKVQPSPYATAGKSSGTGGGAAASNKPSGGSGTGTAANASAASGQSGGTGSGVAASNKGGFANGSQSFSSSDANGVGAGSRGLLGSGSGASGGGTGATSGSGSGSFSGSGSGSSVKPGSSSVKPSTGISPSKPSSGLSGSKGIGGGRAPSIGRR